MKSNIASWMNIAMMPRNPVEGQLNMLRDIIPAAPKLSESVPESVFTHPGMTAPIEREVLFNLARNHFKGEGAIVDAGLFLGASTNAFGHGLRENKIALDRIRERNVRPIKAFEIALWHSAGFDRYAAQPAVQALLNGRVYNNGESYFDFLRELLMPFDQLIDYRIGDIEKLANINETVEIAFYDCLKNYQRDLVAFQAFGPHYEVDKTVIVQQDYFYEDALDCKIRQEFLSPYFTYIGEAATSAVFLMTKPIPQEFFKSDPIKELNVGEKASLLQAAADRAKGAQFKIYAEVGVARFLAMNGRRAEALDRLEQIEASVVGKRMPQRVAEIIESARR